MRNIQDVQIYVIFFRRESKSMCCTNCEDVKASFTFYYVSDYCFLFVCLRQGFSPGFLYVAGTLVVLCVASLQKGGSCLNFW